jgi:ubiquinone/menaquinone biosynthesis C-methylase UbiE
MILNQMERWVVNNPLRISLQWMEIRLLKRMRQLSPGAEVLEIGCGRGAGARLIQKHYPVNRVHAMDLDIRMIQKARKYLSVQEQTKTTLCVGDSVCLPFKAQSLDAVFGFGFLHHVPTWQKAVSEINRVLKTGGIYFIEELYPSLYQNVITKRLLVHPEQNRFESRDLKKALVESDLPLQNAYELNRLGIVGVAVKTGLA